MIHSVALTHKLERNFLNQGSKLRKTAGIKVRAVFFALHSRPPKIQFFCNEKFLSRDLAVFPGGSKFSGLIRVEGVEFILGDDAAYPAFRILHVSPVARNHMDM